MADDVDPPVDPTICINLEAPGASCGGTFQHKTTPGLCAMCYIITKDAVCAEQMKDWPQCLGCSTQLMLTKGVRCGTCLRKDAAALLLPPRDPLGMQDPNQADPSTKQLQGLQAEARRNAMMARTLQKGASKTPAVSASLQVATAKRTPRQITVYLVPITSGGTRTEVSRILANATRSFPDDMPMTASQHPCNLGQFFDTHDRVHGNHPKEILQGPSTLKLPSPAIYLEGLISAKDFENETGTLAPYFVHTEKENRKRKASHDSVASEPSWSKRTRTRSSTPLRLCSDYGDVPGFSKVIFALASVSVAQDGAVKIEWPDLKTLDTTTTSSCLLQDTPFDQGKTKTLIFDGLPWVAKGFFNISVEVRLAELVTFGSRSSCTC
ncbi:hypothetical protein B0H10DRAFT_1958066 [Mycena sp. CBHHK59/15]|nr:hypothetical protein B0H10DRAFT_1958066 [Mycena sp. CBHHK59/15]